MDILIISSDQPVVERLQGLLERQGHRARAVAGVPEALFALEVQRADLLIAECHQLEVNGASLFRLLDRWLCPPLILLMTSQPAMERASSAVGEFERLEAVAVQAQHLLAQQNGESVRVGGLVIDMATKRVTIHGHQVLLPPIQFRLLAYLAQNAGRVVGARELLKAVWGYEGDETEARELVKVHVRQIRRKLGLKVQQPDYVQSVRGFGYMVEAPNGDLA